MIAKFKYQIILFSILIAGFILLNSILNSYLKNEKEKYDSNLIKAKKEAVLNFETGIDVYSTLVSSLRSFIQNSSDFPRENDLHLYLKDLIKDTKFKDSIVVSWVDTNQIFRYCITPYQIDPFHLKGKSVIKLRPKHEIDKLNSLMKEPEIKLFAPVNLIEGWAAFPFNFSAKNSKGKVLGYIAPVVNVKYLLNKIYLSNDSKEYVYQFSVNDSIYFNREEVFDHTKKYNKYLDREDYKNYKDKKLKFIYSEINFYNLKIKIGVAHKDEFKSDSFVANLTYAWYMLLIIFSFILLYQLYKNSVINSKLILTQQELNNKNKELESNIFQIKTLIKEVHHRVKNNLQIIGSLLNLQSSNEQDSEVLKALEKSKNRIQSMALVHQKLYGNETLSYVNVAEYVHQLIENLKSSISEQNKKISIDLKIDKELNFSMDIMIPLGLILNELITNSYKYAFENTEEGQIFIDIHRLEKKKFSLMYRDNGEGIPEKIDIQNSGTLGLELITMLTEQLGGSYRYSKKEAKFEIEFFE